MTGPITCGSGDMAEIWEVKYHPEREGGTSTQEESWGHEGQKSRFDLDPEARKDLAGTENKELPFFS